MRDTFNSGKWSRGRFNSFVTSLLRSGSRRWEPKYTALNDSKTDKKINKKTGRLAQHYQCNCCKQDFPAKDVQVNHIDPVIPLTGFSSWDETIDRLFCERENLEVLCVSCHKDVTKEENVMRKAFSTDAAKATYRCWLDMKSRCFNPNSQRYYTHGGRGITVTEEWVKSFDNFLKDMGERPEGHTLERIDNNGNYEPSNCRWATPKEQALNRRTNVYIEYGDEIKTVSQWADELGISHSSLTKRLAKWDNISDIMTPCATNNITKQAREELKGLNAK